MSEHNVIAGTIGFFIDSAGGTDYDTVVCLTEIVKQDSVAVTSSSTFCGPDQSPGEITIARSATGVLLQDPNSGKISGTNLRLLLRAKTTIGWKIAPLIPKEGDEIETGTGFISEVGSTYGVNSDATFTFAIGIEGSSTITIYAGS